MQIGSSVKLNLTQPASNVWKIDDVVEDDLIDEDNLLDEEDIIKPEEASLRGNECLRKMLICFSHTLGSPTPLTAEFIDSNFKNFPFKVVQTISHSRARLFILLWNFSVCGTTGKRKACKDCSCGLAEELNGTTPQQKTANSSCGNVSHEAEYNDKNSDWICIPNACVWNSGSLHLFFLRRKCYGHADETPSLKFW